MDTCRYVRLYDRACARMTGWVRVCDYMHNCMCDCMCVHRIVHVCLIADTNDGWMDGWSDARTELPITDCKVGRRDLGMPHQ